MPPTPTLLITGGDIVTMGPAREVLLGGSIAITGSRITAVGSTAELIRQHPDAEVLDATGCVVTPGLVDAHQHTTADPLLRSSIPDEISSDEAIYQWAVPVHAEHTGDDDELSATLAAVDALSRGVTTLIEPGTVAHPLRVAAGLRAAGIRARLGGWGWDAEGLPFARPAADVLTAQEALLDALPDHGSTVSAWVTLVGHSTASDALLTGAADLARRRAVGLTLHLSPSAADPRDYLARTGRRPVEHLGDLGVLGPHLLLGHAVHLNDAEVRALLDTDTAVACCPWAYLRLGQGLTRAGRHLELIRGGGRLALGCDAHNAGDAPDVLAAAALLTGLSRDQHAPEGPTPLRADEAFALATIDGARALGLQADIGSIEVGKAADLVVFDGTAPAWVPRGDPALQLVWGNVSGTVRDVLVDGLVVLRGGRSTRVDQEALAKEAQQAQGSLLRRTGRTVPHRWPQRDSR